jgi:tellurite resistance protein
MASRHTRNRLLATESAISASSVDKCDEEILDGVVTASALVAHSDGRIAPAEREMLVDFLDRKGPLFVFTRTEILDAFDRRVSQIEEHAGVEAAVSSLKRFSGRLLARLVIDAARHVAVADGHLRSCEVRLLRLIHGARIPAAALFIVGGLLSVLPILGLWMLPLGLALLADDSPLLRRARDRLLDWIEHRWPNLLRADSQ